MSYDCCYCDYDAPSFYSSRIQRSRRARHCEECGHKIQPGELYEYVAGKWEGFFDTHITCEQCHDMRVWTINQVPCLCWAHGNLEDDCRIAIECITEDAPEETKGLWFALLRRIVKIRKRVSTEWKET